MKNYVLSVHIEDEDELQKFVECDLLEPQYVDIATETLKKRLPCWADLALTDKLELFWFSPERRKILEAGLPLAITPQKE